VTIAVMPPFFVHVEFVCRGDFVEEAAQVAQATTLVLDGCQRAD
jgi:hypothetical protein